MSSKQKFIPGVLGGMGPLATVDFMAKIVAMTDAEADQGHLQLLIDHNPRVPNRHKAIAGDASEVVDALVAMAQRLERAGADFLVMVCNTAHAFQNDIAGAVDIPFVSIVDEVITELDIYWPQAHSVGVMAADGALASRLYQQALEAGGREPIVWSGEELTEFMSLVYRVKAGELSAEMFSSMNQLTASLRRRGAQALIAGCTEIPLLMPAPPDASVSGTPLLSSTDILVASTINYALGNKFLPSR